MMSAEARQELCAESSARAAEDNLHPMVLFSAETAIEDARMAPWLGEFLHEEWEHVAQGEYEEIFVPFERKVFPQDGDDWAWLFIDMSGFGAANEPALNLNQLEALLRALVERADGRTLGVGIVDEGQFQCHLGLYARR